MLTYSPTDVSITYGGKPISGFSDGSFITINRETKPFTHSRAMDGSLSVAVNRNSTYTVKITLAQSSPSNDYLNLVKDVLMKSLGKYKPSVLNFIGNGILNRLPLIIRDKRGSTAFFAQDVFFDEEPDSSFSAGMETRTWVLRCYNVTYSIGGNDEDFITELNKLTTILDFAGVV